jgi:peptide deformylase
MAKLDIITLPDPLLRQRSSAIERVDDAVRRLADDMLETMYDAPGIGLAAVQVAVPRRLIVLDVAEREEGDEGEVQPGGGPVPPASPPPRRPLVMINPEIVRLGDERSIYEEGCLSIPEVRIEIERPAALTVRYLDRDGESRVLEADGLLATAIQHEMDHLDGRLIIDFLSRLKRDIVVRRFKKSARQEA